MNENKDNPDSLAQLHIPRIPFYLLAVAIFMAAAWRVFGSSLDIAKRLDEITLWYLCAAGVVAIIPHMKILKIKDIIEIQNEVRDAKASAEQARSAVNSRPIKFEGELQSLVEKIGVKKSLNYELTKSELEPSESTNPDNKILEELARSIKPGKYNNDPWKGQFGENHIDTANGRKLTATVHPMQDPDWFSVKMEVSSFGKSKPLTGQVIFFIHDTFPEPKLLVDVERDGKASLAVRAWGAFTVGVLADNGTTKLELDLAELKSAPKIFRIR